LLVGRDRESAGVHDRFLAHGEAYLR
jgi:hypothetical protein